MTRRPRAGRPSGWACALLCSVLAELLLLVCSAHAAERQAVRAVFVGDRNVVERIAAVLRPSLDHQGLDLIASVEQKIDPLDAIRVTRDPSAGAPVAYFWLDLNAEQPTLFLAETRSRLIYTRPLKVHADPDDVETEFIRFVVDQSLAEILSGNAPGVTPEEFQRSLAAQPAKPAPAPARRAPPEPPTRQALRDLPWAIDAGYSLSALGSDAIEAGPELSGEWRASPVLLKIRLAQRLPLSVTRDAARVRLVSSAIRLIASSPLTLAQGLSASLGLGAGLDVTQVTPGVDGAVPAFWVSDPLLAAQLAVEQAWGAFLLSGYGGLEWDLLAARYAITRSNGPETVWRPARTRPCAGLSVGYAF